MTTQITQHQIRGSFERSVLEYGAVAGGDLYAAIVAALADNVPLITIPAGTWTLSAGISIDQQVRIDGAGSCAGYDNQGGAAGPMTTKITYSGTTGAAITLVGSGTEGVENIHLSNFSLWGNATCNGGISIGTGTTVTKSSLKNVHVRGFTNAGTDLGYGIKISNCLETIFENVYCQSNNDGFNLYGPAITTLVFISCYSRTNTRYGWLIQEGISSSFYSCLAEGNYSSGLVVNAKADQFVSFMSFFDFYCEGNCVSVAAPVTLIRTTGTGISSDLTFYDYKSFETLGGNVTSLVELGAQVSGVKFKAPTFSTLNTGFAVCTATTTTCLIEAANTINPATAITGNVYVPATGIWNVGTTAAIPLDIKQSTWTPTIVSGATTGGNAAGTYQKVGRLVTVNGRINASAMTSPIVIGGLPFTCDDTTLAIAGCGSASNFDTSTPRDVLFVGGGTTLSISYSAAYGGGPITIYFGGTYFSK